MPILQSRHAGFRLVRGHPLPSHLRASLTSHRPGDPHNWGEYETGVAGLVEQLVEFTRRELAAPAIRNPNPVSGCFELAGFGDRDHRTNAVRLVAATVF